MTLEIRTKEKPNEESVDSVGVYLAAELAVDQVVPLMAPGDEVGERREFPDGVERVDDGERPAARNRSRSSTTTAGSQKGNEG